MKIALANFTGERANWGCQATSIELVNFLAGYCLPADAELKLIPLPAKHEVDWLHEAVYGHKIRKIYSKDNPSNDDLDFLEEITKDRFGSYFHLVREADVVLFQGEGSVGPESEFHSVRLFGLPFLASKKWKKPVAAINLTMYAATQNDAAILRTLFSSFVLISVREAASLVFARELGLGHLTVLCPDMAFRQSSSYKSPAEDTSADYFCVSGSALRMIDKPSLVTNIEHLSRATGMSPTFIFSRRPDAAGVVDRLRGARIISPTEKPDYRELQPILARARFVFGGRYHSAVSALSQATPIILLPGNTFKSEGISDIFSMDFPVYDPGDVRGITRAAKKCVALEDQYRKRIKAGLKRIATMQESFAHLLKGVVVDGAVNGKHLTELQMEPLWLDRGYFTELYRNQNMAEKRIYFFPKVRLRNLKSCPDYENRIRKTFDFTDNRGRQLQHR